MARIVVLSYPRSSNRRRAASTMRVRVSSRRGAAASSGTTVTVAGAPGAVGWPATGARPGRHGEHHVPGAGLTARSRQPLGQRAVLRRRPQARDPGPLGPIHGAVVRYHGDLLPGAIM